MACVVSVDVDSGSGVLDEEVAHIEIDVGEDRSQVDRVAAVGLIWGKFTNLFGSGESRQLLGPGVVAPCHTHRGQRQDQHNNDSEPRI